MYLALILAMVSSPPYDIPIAKKVIRAMDDIISNHIAVYDWPAWSAAMQPFWTPDFVYDSVYGIGNFTGLKAWFDGEHVHWNHAFDQVAFNQLIFVAEAATASTTTYAAARWYGALAGMPPTGGRVHVRICDFYRLQGERISYNWMMLDLPDVLRQACAARRGGGCLHRGQHAAAPLERACAALSAAAGGPPRSARGAAARRRLVPASTRDGRHPGALFAAHAARGRRG